MAPKQQEALTPTLVERSTRMAWTRAVSHMPTKAWGPRETRTARIDSSSTNLSTDAQEEKKMVTMTSPLACSPRFFSLIALGLTVAIVAGCGDDAESNLGSTQSAGGTSGTSSGGASGAGGSAGSAGDAGAGGGGSSGASGTAGASGSSGSGGAAGASGSAGAGGSTPGTCGVLIPAGGPSSPTPNNVANHLRGSLVLADSAGGAHAVSLVIAITPVESPVVQPTAIQHVEFDPWTTFPTSLGDPVEAVGVGGDTYVAGPAITKGFSVLYSTLPPVPSLPDTALFLDPNVGVGEAATGVPVGADSDTPLFVTSNGALALGGSAQAPLGVHHASAFHLVENGAATSFPEVGCATTDVLADAIPWGAGFLVAYSTSRSCCLCDNGIDSTPSSLVLATLVGGQLNTLSTQQNDSSASYSFVKLIKSSDGSAWLITKISGGFADGPFTATLVSPDGSLALSSLEIVPSGVSYQPPVVAALGKSLGVAWTDETGQVPHAFVRVFDPSGSATVPVGFDSGFGQLTSALGSPDGRHLLVNWTAYGQPGPQQITQVARFDCTGPVQ